MKYATILILVLAAAWVGAQLVQPAPAGAQLPAGAQAIVETALAGGNATRIAQATATDQSARATSTTAALATRDALALAQTQTSLSVAGTQAALTVTLQVAAATAGAQQTRVWATPTAAAMQTQAVATAAALVQRQARADSAAQFWALLRWLVLGVLGLLGLAVVGLVVARGAVIIHAEQQRRQAATARDAFRVLAGGLWAEWLPGQGYHVYPVPGQLPTGPVIEQTLTQPNWAHAWRQSVRLFAHWGDRHGFGIREMGAAGAAVVGDPAWRTLSKLLKDAGVLAEVRRDGQKGRVTAWAEGWDYRRLAHELTYGPLTLPFPEQADPPKVAYTVPTQHHN